MNLSSPSTPRSGTAPRGYVSKNLQEFLHNKFGPGRGRHPRPPPQPPTGGTRDVRPPPVLIGQEKIVSTFNEHLRGSHSSPLSHGFFYGTLLRRKALSNPREANPGLRIATRESSKARTPVDRAATRKAGRCITVTPPRSRPSFPATRYRCPSSVHRQPRTLSGINAQQGVSLARVVRRPLGRHLPPQRRRHPSPPPGGSGRRPGP